MLLLAEGGGEGEACLTTSTRSEEHTSELQSRSDLVCRLLLEKKKKKLGAPSPEQWETEVPPVQSQRQGTILVILADRTPNRAPRPALTRRAPSYSQTMGRGR